VKYNENPLHSQTRSIYLDDDIIEEMCRYAKSGIDLELICHAVKVPFLFICEIFDKCAENEGTMDEFDFTSKIALAYIDFETRNRTAIEYFGQTDWRAYYALLEYNTKNNSYLQIRKGNGENKNKKENIKTIEYKDPEYDQSVILEVQKRMKLKG